MPSADASFLAKPLPARGPSIAKFREKARINVGFGYLLQPTLLAEDLLAVVSDDEAKLRVYSTSNRRLVSASPVPGFSQFHTGPIARWPGPVAKVLVGSDQGLLRIDAKTGTVDATLSERAFHTLRWSADGELLLAVSGGPETQRSEISFFQYEGDTLRLLRTLPFDERIDGVDLGRDRRLLAVSLYPSNTVRVLDIEHDPTELVRVQAPLYGGACAFSPNGRLLAIGGAGVLVVDLVNPNRRGFYSHIYNNVGHVQFTPSGDTLLASGYDGRVRAFSIVGPSRDGLELSLKGELRHDARANVYGVAITEDGRTVISGSGDRTLRFFSSSEAPKGDANGERFRSIAEWKSADPDAARPIPEADLGRVEQGRYLVPALSAPARPSRILPGRYACKITAIYKYRDCTVERDPDGRTILTFLAGNLLPLRGVLYDDGDVVRYEAALQEEGTVASCEGCSRQPLQGFFRGKGGSYEGLLTFRTVFDAHKTPPLPAPNASIEEALDRFPISLRRKD